MVTFPAVGRMGNYLFECSTALAYSLKHNLDFTIPTETTSHIWSPIYLHHLANRNYDPTLEKVHVWENGHQYQELPFEESYRNKNVVIEGYRQSWKYIDEYRKEILYAFDLPYEFKKDLVSIHVRRGDYLHLTQKHPPVTKEWYELAMSKFPGKKFKFFSDDIRWCKDTFGSRSDCYFSTNSSELGDMIEGSCSEHQIISASTFGWWMAWLNRNPEKVVYIPELWFMPGWDGLDTSDIVPPYFTKL